MKLIKTLNLANSIYSGKQKRFTELTMKPSAKTDENGNPLGMNKRYYTFRFLSFEHGDRTDSPFIIRHEHVKYVKDSDGKITGVEKITCPTTEWAKNRLAKQGEPVGKGYCPICEYSFAKNKEAFAVKGHRDSTASRLAFETQRQFAAYWPVYVVNDPHYMQNNQHMKVLCITDKEGFNKLVESIEYVMTQKNLNVFNGEEGVNFAILVERVAKVVLDKNGNQVINKNTGKPYVRYENKITDIKASTKNLVAYPQINDKAIEELDFDGTYSGIESASKDASAPALSVDGRKVSFSGNVKQVRVFDLAGRSIQRSRKASFTVDSAAGHAVLLEVTDAEGNVSTHKVALQ